MPQRDVRDMSDDSGFPDKDVELCWIGKRGEFPIRITIPGAECTGYGWDVGEMPTEYEHYRLIRCHREQWSGMWR